MLGEKGCGAKKCVLGEKQMGKQILAIKILGKQ
jgi:hypothetical protein